MFQRSEERRVGKECLHQCRSRKGKEGDTQQENNHEANVTGDVLQDALILSFENVTDSWVVDLGASFYATPDKKYLHTMFKEILDKSVG